jgi:hypothetical protein
VQASLFGQADMVCTNRKPLISITCKRLLVIYKPFTQCCKSKNSRYALHYFMSYKHAISYVCIPKAKRSGRQQAKERLAKQ